VTEDRWPGVFALADITGFGYCSRIAATYRDEGLFTPPSLQGTIVYPATVGGVEWGGGAVDPTSRVFIVNSSKLVQTYRLIPREEFNAELEGGRTTGGLFRMEGAPVPFALTVHEAASPVAGQLFILVGVAILLPVILLCTALVYRLFWGRIVEKDEFHRG
jgi:quinoprotein glucose dehydrogenase